MFALDVFGEPQWFLALLIHLIPSYILIAATVVAWRNERVGGFIFIVLGVAFLFISHFESLIISIPPMIIGGIFLINGFFDINPQRT